MNKMKKITSSVEGQIAKFIIKDNRFKITAIEENKPLFESGLLDSLGFATLLGFIHKRFGVFIDMTEMGVDKVDTIKKISDIIRKNI